MSVYLWVKAYINLVQHYHHSWAHSCGIWLWVISSDFKFINIVLLKSDTCTLWSTQRWRYWLLLAVLSIFKYLYPCKRLWCLMSGPSFNSSLNWGSEKSDNELVYIVHMYHFWVWELLKIFVLVRNKISSTSVDAGHLGASLSEHYRLPHGWIIVGTH